MKKNHLQFSKNPYSLYIYAIRNSKLFAKLCLFLGTISLSGYFIGLEALYRPIAGGPATNPLTAMCIILTGFCYWKYSHKNQSTILIIAAFVVLITGIRSCEYLFDIHIFSQFKIIDEIINYSGKTGQRNTMGLNTAIMLLLIALAIITRVFHKPLASQTLAFLALSLPSISITGYAYNITNFYGEMSLVTTCLGLLIAFAALGALAHRGFMRALLSPYIGGRLARLQCIIGYSVCFGFGYLITRTVLQPTIIKPLGLYVVTICWFIVALISLSALIQENIDRRRRYFEKQLHISATTDPLTGLLNRRSFMQEASAEVHRQKRIGYNLAVMLIDIDYFKKVNDILGHSAGDHVLKLISKEIKNSLRQTDLICRYGGEEFAVILPDTSLLHLKKVSQKILNHIRTVDASAVVPSCWPITVSIGYHEIFNDEKTIVPALDRADKALYQAKYNGRDQAVQYDHQPSKDNIGVQNFEIDSKMIKNH